MMKVVESVGSGLRVFENGVNRHLKEVEEIAKEIGRLADVRTEDDDPHMMVQTYGPLETWWGLADRLYSLLGDKEEAIKFVNTVAVIFPGLLVEQGDNRSRTRVLESLETV